MSAVVAPLPVLPALLIHRTAAPAAAASVSGVSNTMGLAVKRVLDVVGAAVGLLLLAPVLLALIAAVKLTDPDGPVFYRQNRLGRHGRVIGVLKFRSMLWKYSTGPDRPFQTAEQVLLAMGREDLVREYAVSQKLADDPRVSRLGRLIRRTSLDELPQLINTLLGQISLVGPRPLMLNEVERYGEHIPAYLSVKPGITGLWQVSGRSETTFEERVRLDVAYVRSWSTKLDISILFRTVGVVLAGRGAA